MKDLTGEKYGRLTIVAFSHRTYNSYYWQCRCSCGKLRVIRSGDLKNGKTKSCGCLHKEGNHTTHGLKKTLFIVDGLILKRDAVTANSNILSITAAEELKFVMNG